MSRSSDTGRSGAFRIEIRKNFEREWRRFDGRWGAGVGGTSVAGTSKGAVLGALLGNGMLTVIKFGAFAVSGSGAIFSEAIHSLADTANQGMLFLGIRRSERPADHLFHYGYGADRYFYSLMSAVGIFVLGCGVTVYHGIHDLMSPPQLEVSWIPLVVLAISFAVEGVILMMAARVVWAAKGTQSLRQYLATTSDPTIAAVLLEDAVACVGVLVAAAGIGLAHLTGNPTFDALGAIAIGLMLGVVAIWLGLRNRALLLGPAIPAEVHDEIVAFLREHPAVMRVRKARSRVVGADRFRFKAEIDFDGRYLGRRLAPLVAEHSGSLADEASHEAFAAAFGGQLLDELGREVDTIEAELARRYPMLEYVDLEAD
jgi:zinc transporter 9